jgi:hypothetical protein
VAGQGAHVAYGQYGQRRGEDDGGADTDRSAEPEGGHGGAGENLPDRVEDQRAQHVIGIHPGQRRGGHMMLHGGVPLHAERLQAGPAAKAAARITGSGATTASETSIGTAASTPYVATSSGRRGRDHSASSPFGGGERPEGVVH